MRADRLLSLILLLQTRGKMTARDLASELEVSPRTILRDVEALSIAGIPVYTDGGHGGGIALDENYRTSLTGIKESEAWSLFVSGNAKLLSDVGLGDAAESLLLKLFAALPAAHQPSVDYIRQRIYIDPLWWWHDAQPLPFWEALQKAVYEDRRIRVIYENHAHEIIERDLEPYSLVAKSSLWYLIAKRDGTLRTYRVSRFQDVTLLDATFQRDAGFDLPAYWQAHVDEFATSLAEYEFTLRIHPDRLNFVRWLTPGRCDVLGDPDERGWITVRLRYETPQLAAMLVFGLGMQAQIVAPDDLRDAVVSTAREILETHG